MTANMEQQLVVTRRKILRTMLHARRLPDEEWVDFLKRSTAIAERKMEELGYVTWLAAYRRRKWRFAARVAKAVDNRWSNRLLGWCPHFRCSPCRSVGRPLTRWYDCFVNIAGGDWQVVAQSKFWSLLEDGFIHCLA